MDKRTPKSWSLYFYWVPSFSYFVTGGRPFNTKRRTEAYWRNARLINSACTTRFFPITHTESFVNPTCYKHRL